MLAVTSEHALSNQERRASIDHFESILRTMPQVEVPTEHTFGPGFYARTIHLKAGTTLTGKVHATEHIFILSKGELLVATEDGEQHLVAPVQVVCRPGLKRAGHAITDVVCTNIHITEKTDLLELEQDLIISDARHVIETTAPSALEA